MHPIQTRDLTVIYRSGVLARPVVGLEGLDLSLEEGEVFGYIGANGTGKTTTIKAMLGLVRPTRGEAFLFGKSTTDPASRREVGFLPEAPYFYEYLTGRETTAFYARLSGVARGERETRAGDALERVGLSAAADRRVGTYSRGMRQRLGLAQAIVHAPRLLILDEPMSGLDPLGRREVRLLIQELARAGATVFFSSHILSDVEALCDRVGVLAGGKLVAAGRPEELIEKLDDKLGGKPGGKPGGGTGGARVKAVELRCSGIPLADAASLCEAARAAREDGGVLAFEAPDEEAANRAAKLILDRGGKLHSMVPVKESLEDIFTRLQADSAGSDANDEEEKADG